MRGITGRICLYIFLCTTLLLPFQNCGRTDFANNSPPSDTKSNGGDGYGGKVFRNYGSCADGKVDVKSTILVSASDGSMSLSRENCADLNPARPIDPAQVTLPIQDQSVFVFNNAIFDLSQPTGGKRTRALCWSGSGAARIEASVWQIGDILYGHVLKATEATPQLTPVKETQSSPDTDNFNIAADAAGNFLNLNFRSNGMATLDYAIAGGSSATASSMICSSQIAAYDDGAQNASTGEPQRPTLFSDSGEVVQPPWNVAGVDFAVGVPAGKILKDPTTTQLPSGVTLDTSSRTVRVTGDNVVLDGYDFALHNGYQVLVDGANAVISDSNFALGTNTASYLIYGLASASNLTVQHCTLDASTGGTNTGLIGMRGSGAVTLTYNWFKNFPQHVLELAQDPGTSFSVTYKYNLIDQGRGTHLNYLQFNSGTTMSVDVEFNTSYQSSSATAGDGYEFYNNGVGGGIATAILAYNTIIVTGGAPGSAMSSLVTSSGSKGTIHDNYMDKSAATAFFNISAGFTYSKNIDLKTGASIP